LKENKILNPERAMWHKESHRNDSVGKSVTHGASTANGYHMMSTTMRDGKTDMENITDKI